MTGCHWGGWLQTAVTKCSVPSVIFFIVGCGIARFLCAMHAFKVWASSPSQGYFCAKFRFCGNLHCWASPWRKTAYSITHSVTHSLTQLIWCPDNRSFCFGIKKSLQKTSASARSISRHMAPVDAQNSAIPGAIPQNGKKPVWDHAVLTCKISH